MVDSSVIVTGVIALGVLGYLVYMQKKVRHFVFRNDKIDKYYKNR